MKDHHFKVHLKPWNINEASIKLGDLKYFVRHGEVDEHIRKSFPIIKYGDFNEKLNIYGTRSLVDAFEQIDKVKLDIPEKLENIRFIGFSQNRQLILRFIEDRLNAIGTYNFTSEFLDNVFHMGKFSRFCFEHGYTDILKDNIEDLINKMGHVEMQYRLIKKDDKFLIRAITSTKYNNYDNHLAIYLALISLHDYAKNENIFFKVEEAHLSDSEIKIFIQQINPKIIIGFGKVYFGVLITNNELGKGTFSLEFRYKIIDENGKNFNGIQDVIFNIRHDTGIKNVTEKLINLNNISKMEETFLEHVYAVVNTPYLTENRLYKILKDIIEDKRKFGKETRQNVKKIRDDNLVNNTMTIIEVFDRLSEITTDIDERIYLERLYHKAINEIAKNSQ